ncbi:MAG TPA: hypothetical protein VHP37_01700 [Burkholderiales bacterium]|nr:hypothetical protein [Burkholderiales bacterium]
MPRLDNRPATITIRRVTLSLLDPEDLEQLVPAETQSFPSPIPTQFVSSDEFLPDPQTENQKKSKPASRRSAASSCATTRGWRISCARAKRSARLYKYTPQQRAELATDEIAMARATYLAEGPHRTNRRYGYVVKPTA